MRLMGRDRHSEEGGRERDSAEEELKDVICS